MRFRSCLLPAVTITGGTLLIGCNGGNSNGSCGSYGSCGPAPVYSSVGGVYEGTVQGVPVIAILAENGDGRISGQDGTYYNLTVNTQPNNSVAGTYYADSTGPLFPNGSLLSSGTVSAVLNPTTLNGSLIDQTGAAANLRLSFDTVYNLGSALPTLAGTWSYTANSFSLTATILSNGAFTAVDSTGCSYTGSFYVIDPNFNAYGESHTRACNGVTLNYAGLAAYFPPAGNGGAHIQLLADDNVGDDLVIDLQ